MSVADFTEALEELIEEVKAPAIKDAEPEPVVKTPAELRHEAMRARKRTSRTTLRVRDTLDEHGDLMFDLSMCTYDRRAIDDIAERYNLNLIFVNEYNDYERDEWRVQPTEASA